MDVYDRRRLRLLELLREIPAAELARRSQVDATLISRYKVEPGQKNSKRIGEEVARKIEGGAGKPYGWLDKQHSPGGMGSSAQAQDLSHPPGQHSPTSRSEVPVLFVARPAATGGLQLESIENGGTVNAAFAGPRAFAFKVNGDALYPAVRHGVYVVCDPDTPCAAGEPVLIEMVDGSMSMRELVLDREVEITTLGMNGGQRETVPRTAIKRMTAITMTVYASRWRAA